MKQGIWKILHYSKSYIIEVRLEEPGLSYGSYYVGVQGEPVRSQLDVD